MLDDVLRLAAKKGRLSAGEFARDLATSPAVVAQMFAELARRGYLEEVAPPCDAPCRHCSAKVACQIKLEPRLWTLTAKGERALHRLSGRNDGDEPQS